MSLESTYNRKDELMRRASLPAFSSADTATVRIGSLSQGSTARLSFLSGNGALNFLDVTVVNGFIEISVLALRNLVPPAGGYAYLRAWNAAQQSQLSFEAPNQSFFKKADVLVLHWGQERLLNAQQYSLVYNQISCEGGREYVVPVEQVFTVDTNGQTLFQLSTPPARFKDTALYLNGVLQLENIDYDIEEATLQWTNLQEPLVQTDVIQLRYLGVEIDETTS
ncbi:MAG TPA: hypothetical protein DCM08_05880 [Microscillaceae bacterium]|jgi:hypothetical protein|nr:hypothetical protein [Microscillaceae bacterium]